MEKHCLQTVENKGPIYLHLFVGGLMYYLRYVYLFTYCGVQHILCCVCLRLVHPVLPVSLDCPFWIALRYSLTFYLHDMYDLFCTHHDSVSEAFHQTVLLNNKNCYHF